MTRTHSMPRGRRRKPQSVKPSKDLPFTSHPSGRWCKKVLGKIHYLKKIAENDNGMSASVALEKWL